MSDAEYWEKVKTLPTKVLIGGGGSQGDVWVVDWSEEFGAGMGTGVFVLGYNPIDQKWIDPYIQYVSLTGKLFSKIKELQKTAAKRPATEKK